jgi:hypothetical protein
LFETRVFGLNFEQSRGDTAVRDQGVMPQRIGARSSQAQQEGQSHLAVDRYVGVNPVAAGWTTPTIGPHIDMKLK